MIQFPATFHGFRKTVVGESLLTLSIDESFSKEAAELLGKQTNAMFMVYLEDVAPEDDIKKDSKGVKEKFMIRLHVLLSELSDARVTTPEEEKDRLKRELIAAGVIEKSTKELSVKELARVCSALEETIKHAHGK